MSLLAYLSKIEDPRRKQGQRYPLGEMLLLVILGTLAGRVGYRAISRFGKEHEAYLSKVLNLKHGVPSHVSLTKIVDQTDINTLEKAVNEWFVSEMGTTKSKRVIALDGKAVKASVRQGTSNYQSTVALVNSFCLEKGLVLGALSYENTKGKKGEVSVLKDLVETLGITDAIFTADANHAKKNTRTTS